MVLGFCTSNVCSPAPGRVKETARRKSVAEELAENLEGEIRNPLHSLTREELLANVTRFQTEKGLPEDILPILKKGALVAQNPAAFETMPELDEAEKLALRQEVTHRWKHPWALYFTIVLNSIAAAIQGWDQVCFPPFSLPP